MAKRTLDGVTLALLSLLLAGFALRLWPLDTHSLWYDELLQLDIAQGPLANIGPQLIRHAAMPLDYYILHGWIGLGRQDGWVRLPALFFGVLTIPLLYALARSMFNRQVAVLAAGLLACSFFAIRYSLEARPYALLLCCTTLTFLGLWRVHHTGRWRYWPVVGLGLTGAVASHYFALFLLPPLLLFVGGWHLYRWCSRRAWPHLIGLLLVLAAVLLVVVASGRFWHLYSVGERFTREAAQPELYTLPAAEKPNRGAGPPLSREFLVENLLMSWATVEPLPLLLYALFLLTAVLTLTRRQQPDRAALLLLLSWWLLPALLVYLFLLHRGTFFAIRYILFTLPPFLVLVAYGVHRLAKTAAVWLVANTAGPPLRVWQAALAGLALTLLTGAQLNVWQRFYRADAYEDWRAVAYLLQANAHPADAVIAVKAESALNWYYPPAAAPVDTYSRSAPIWNAIRQHRRQWFVLSSYSFKRDEGLRVWLRNQGAIKIGIDRRLVVYFREEGKSAAELLAVAQTFTLPNKAAAHASLAEQFNAAGYQQASRSAYRRAIDLAATPAQRAAYQTQLAALAHP